MGKQNKLYRKDSWKQRCQQIIEADGNACCDCGRQPPEVVLQVHHLKYEKGKKPWEYNREDLITLCKGCHARRHNLIESIPEDVWEYVGCTDLGGLYGICEFCGTEIRYEHYIYHPDYGEYMSVGCHCSDKLTGINTASQNDHVMHLNEQRLQRYINSPKWKKHKNCYFFPDLEGYKIMIAETNYGYYLTLIYSYLYNNYLRNVKEHSSRKYDSLIDAKKQIYYAITTGEMQKYLVKNEKPYPGQTLYQ